MSVNIAEIKNVKIARYNTMMTKLYKQYLFNYFLVIIGQKKINKQKYQN